MATASAGDRARAGHQAGLLLLDEPAAGMNPTEKLSSHG
jgi:ABC-type branched-subunit amino acid transport system ATPase component